MSCRFMAVSKVWCFSQRNLNETVSLWRPGRWAWGRKAFHGRGFASEYWLLQLLDVFVEVQITPQYLAGRQPGRVASRSLTIPSLCWGLLCVVGIWEYLIAFHLPGAVQNFIFLFFHFCHWRWLGSGVGEATAALISQGLAWLLQGWSAMEEQGSWIQSSWHGRWLDWSTGPFWQAVQTDPSLLTSLPLNSLRRPYWACRSPGCAAGFIEHVQIPWNHHTRERQEEEHKGAGIPLFITLTSLETPSRLKEGPSLHPHNRCSCRKSLWFLASPA